MCKEGVCVCVCVCEEDVCVCIFVCLVQDDSVMRRSLLRL